MAAPGWLSAPPSGYARGMTDVVVLDVDGTLVDTNYHHAIAWYRAFRRYDIDLPVWRLHRAIGMGGDRLVGAVAGEQVEADIGDRVRAAWEEEFAPLLAEVRPLAGVARLLGTVRDRGCAIVLASSGKPEHVDHYLDMIDGRAYAKAWTTAEDVEASKPAPDLLVAALSTVDGDRAMMIGDSPWDCQAAGRLHLPCVALRTGGFGEQELRDAGAATVFDALTDLTAALPDLPFADIPPSARQR
jgi:beta-phosphoglucomutase-like phosphatase (HAD superfamily)